MSDEDGRRFKMKFAHRKKLLFFVGELDYLQYFLRITGLQDHYNDLRSCGFKNLWSVLGVTEKDAGQMQLTSDEMKIWLQQEVLEKEVGEKNQKSKIKNQKSLLLNRNYLHRLALVTSFPSTPSGHGCE